MEEQENEPIALHVLVVGFHHKKGMQVEYAYPPLSSSCNGCDLPDKWRHLPSLCLPDGAHNHEADTIYFHLPHLTKDTQTVFGVSCYRQIDAEKVANKTADITRNSVQKSVCVLTTLPIYGYVQERLRGTTKVYFKGADFSDVRDLEGLYADLNNANWRDRLMHGICVSDAVRLFGRNLLVLFKLLLLERRVLFFGSPVAPLVQVVMSLLALLPDNFPDGLAQAAATNNECNEPDIQNVQDNDADVKPELNIEENCRISPSATLNEVKEELNRIGPLNNDDEAVLEPLLLRLEDDKTADVADGVRDESDNSSLTSVTSRSSMMSPNSMFGLASSTPEAGEGAAAANLSAKLTSLKGRLSGAFNYWTSKDKTADAQNSVPLTPNPSPSEPATPMSGLLSSLPHSAPESLTEEQQPAASVFSPASVEKFAAIDAATVGLPLQIFTKGNLLHPYLSLQYLDVLTAATTRAFVVGASNTLFVHKRNLYDVLVHVEDGKLEVYDPELRRQLALSTEDLRFADHVVKQVEAVAASVSDAAPADVFVEGVGWVGGEEWLRHQFKVYLLAMLRSSLCPDSSRERESFNSVFVNAWRETHNYRVWASEAPYAPLLALPAAHPNSGTLSITDMRIRLSHTIQGLDRGRRINQTLANTGTAVVKTREAVGGAFTSARGAITNLWSSFTSPPSSNALFDEVGLDARANADDKREIEAEEASEAVEMETTNEEMEQSVNAQIEEDIPMANFK